MKLEAPGASAMMKGGIRRVQKFTEMGSFSEQGTLRTLREYSIGYQIQSKWVLLFAFEFFHVFRVVFKRFQLFQSGINRKHVHDVSENPFLYMLTGCFPRYLLVWCAVVSPRFYPCFGVQIQDSKILV